MDENRTNPARVERTESGTTLGSARERLLLEQVTSLSSQLAGLREALTKVVALDTSREDMDVEQARTCAAWAFVAAKKIARAALHAAQAPPTPKEPQP
jgi:hypothetical protein